MLSSALHLKYSVPNLKNPYHEIMKVGEIATFKIFAFLEVENELSTSIFCMMKINIPKSSFLSIFKDF